MYKLLAARGDVDVFGIDPLHQRISLSAVQVFGPVADGKFVDVVSVATSCPRLCIDPVLSDRGAACLGC